MEKEIVYTGGGSQYS